MLLQYMQSVYAITMAFTIQCASQSLDRALPQGSPKTHKQLIALPKRAIQVTLKSMHFT